MKEIKKIMVATDFSDPANNAFRYALWFASKCQADICLLHVIYPSLEPTDVPVMSAQSTKVKAEAAKAVMQVIIEHSTADFKHGPIPKIETEVAIGIAAILIAKTAQKNNADLIIMGAKGKHNVFERNIGNVTFATLDAATCPVLVIPENTHSLRIETIAYATDLAESDPFHIWKTGQLLNPFNPILRIVHIQRKTKEDKAIAMEELEDFFKGNAPTIQVTFHHLFNKKITDKLDDFIKEWDVDLLIMNKPQRNIIERIFQSSLTKKTALHTKVPFLVLK